MLKIGVQINQRSVLNVGINLYSQILCTQTTI